MNIAEYIIQHLEDIGVKHIFTVVGGGAIFLDDALSNSKKIKPIFCLHEQAAAIAAEAYSQAGGIGVVLVTTGPGVTNALTGVAGAYLESTPLLVISGQVNTFHSAKQFGTRQFGFQEIDTEAIVTPIVKQYWKIYPENLREKLQDLLVTMCSGRPGPVWLDIPLDVQGSTPVKFTEDKNKVDTRKKDLSLAKETADLLIKRIELAKKPAILIGNGVRLAHVEKECKELIGKLNIPVLCTWKTFDMFKQDDLLYMGRPGIVASRYANEIQQECDLLLCLGARLDLGQVAFNYENFAPKAQKIIFDIDENESTKWARIKNTSFGHYNLESVIPELLESSNVLPKTPWLEHCQTLKKKYNLKEEHSKNPNFNYYKILNHIEEGLQDGDIIVHGSSGSCSEMTCQALETNKDIRVIGTHGLGSMGFGLPAAIGAHFATGKRIICIEGDGSLAMNIQELELIKRYNLPICIIVLNNNGYSSIVNTQNKLFDGKHFGSNPASGLTLPNYRDIAIAFEIDYYHINSSTIKEPYTNMLQVRRPVIHEVFLDEKDTVSYPRTHTKMIDGQITTMPMEDLWPEETTE